MKKSAKIREQIEALKAAADAAEKQEREVAKRRVARIVERSGLAAIDVSSDVLERELRALRERLTAVETGGSSNYYDQSATEADTGGEL